MLLWQRVSECNLICLTFEDKLQRWILCLWSSGASNWLAMKSFLQCCHCQTLQFFGLMCPNLLAVQRTLRYSLYLPCFPCSLEVFSWQLQAKHDLTACRMHMHCCYLQENSTIVHVFVDGEDSRSPCSSSSGLSNWSGSFFATHVQHTFPSSIGGALRYTLLWLYQRANC